MNATSENPNWGTKHKKKAMTFPRKGEPLVYTDVHTNKKVTIRRYKLLKMTYNTAFTRTQKNKKESAQNKDKGSDRNKRTWLVEYEVVVRKGMVHASQGRISKNNELNLVEIKFVKRDELTRGTPRTFQGK